MFREKIKVLDCTIRDGGLINDHYFNDKFVREVYRALSESGIDYMEMGYRSSRQLYPDKDFGAWKYCDDEKIREITDGIESKLKLCVMVDAHRVKEQQFAGDNTHVRVTGEGINHGRQPAGGGLGVVVEQNDNITFGRGITCIAGAGETPVFTEL